MNAKLPAGLHARPVVMEDLHAAVDLFNTYARSVNGETLELETVRREWELPEMNLAEDTIAVFDREERPVAYSEFWDSKTHHVRFVTYSVVHPDYQCRGLGAFLVDWQIEHGRRNLARAPEDARVVLHQYVIYPNEPACRLLTRYGFQAIRSSHMMQIDFDEPPRPPAPVDGLVIRPIANGEEKRAAMYAAYESFRDHWGMVDEPFEAYYQRWLEGLKTDPLFDPSLWFIALDGNEVAGVSLCRDHIDEDPDRGWVGTLGVRRPWRKRGLGQALLEHSFCELYQRGKVRAGLGVDASNLTGATRLYERAGMRVVRRYDLYELELRAGKDYMVQAIEA